MKTVLGAVVLVAWVAAAQTPQQPTQPMQPPSRPMQQPTQPMQAPSQAQQATRQAVTADMQKTFGFVPAFLSSMPDAALPGVWEQMKALQLSSDTAIPPRYKELIGLAVSSQIPCEYCVYAHRELARANGASDAELGVAIAEAAITRQWSTFLNGAQIDEPRFRQELTKMTTALRQATPAGRPPQPTVAVTDAETAYQDIERHFGFVPDYLRRYPKVALPGAWRTLRDVEMNPNGPVPSKYLVLAGLAVASQAPCKYCIVADTELARTFGASDAEISEAIALGGYTRAMSTLLNGMQVDFATFKADIDRMAKPRGKKQAMLTP